MPICYIRYTVVCIHDSSKASRGYNSAFSKTLKSKIYQDQFKRLVLLCISIVYLWTVLSYYLNSENSIFTVANKLQMICCFRVTTYTDQCGQALTRVKRKRISGNGAGNYFVSTTTLHTNRSSRVQHGTTTKAHRRYPH